MHKTHNKPQHLRIIKKNVYKPIAKKFYPQPHAVSRFHLFLFFLCTLIFLFTFAFLRQIDSKYKGHSGLQQKYAYILYIVQCYVFFAAMSLNLPLVCARDTLHKADFSRAGHTDATTTSSPAPITLMEKFIFCSHRARTCFQDAKKSFLIVLLL